MIDLSENEMEVLRILWESGESKPGEIQEQFSWAIDNGTLRSTLVNLVRKRHVIRQRQGKAFFYSARVQKRTALGSFMRSLAHIFARGSTRDLVAQLVDTSDLTAADLDLLRRTANGQSKRPGKSE